MTTTRNGGIVTIGPDNNVYTVTGDLGGKRCIQEPRPKIIEMVQTPMAEAAIIHDYSRW